MPGSGSVVASDELERSDYTDMNQVMSAVPGVYVREEDGFGLRREANLQFPEPRWDNHLAACSV